MALKGYFFILMAACLWGIIGPLSKLAFKEGLYPMEVAFWRAVLTWIFFAAHAIITGQTKFEKKDVPYLVLFGFFGITLFYWTYQMAVLKGGAAFAAVLLYTAPAWVAVMSGLFLKEHITIAKIIALILTIAGVWAISFRGGAESFDFALDFNGPAVFYGLASGFCYALYYIFGKHFSERYTSPNLFLYILPIGIFGLLPWVSFSHKTPLAWTSLFILAFLSTYGANYCYYKGLQYLEPTRAAVTATFEPVVAAVVAYFWWNEYFSFTGYAGSVLILSSVLIMVVDGVKKSRNKKIKNNKVKLNL